ncbi:MAG: 2,3-bisphosphoglycerate-independent phosphoglycerate mutase [Oscillospiraceae bacterium]
MKKPLMLMILDGFGNTTKQKGNAILGANTPNIDKLFAQNPYTMLSASGEEVGLPSGQMGNSEVGHTNIGAGRIVYQELTRISKAIDTGDFFNNEAILKCMESCKKQGTALHLMGLLSDGGVHSHTKHLYALLDLAKAQGLKKVYIHCFLDGRDVSPASGKNYVSSLLDKLEQLKLGEIATVVGRYYAMDRDNRWNRVKIAYDAMVLGKGEYHPYPVQAVEDSYEQQTTDEFIEPFICSKTGTISADDGVILFNFRPDRAREITRAFVDPEFDGFERAKGFFHLNYVCMTQYDAVMPNVEVAFKPNDLKDTFGEMVSKCGMTQLRIAETEKYAHVTFFFNGGKETVFKGEKRILVPSPQAPTYDTVPEMSAYKVTDKVIEAIASGEFDVIVLNYANCDMIGHTGNYDATVKAVEIIDECVGRVAKQMEKSDGVLIITADHGNAEQMYDEDGSPHTAHTVSPVPFMIAGKKCSLRSTGCLADIAPTMLQILDIPQSLFMNGKSLIC